MPRRRLQMATIEQKRVTPSTVYQRLWIRYLTAA
jgi:hypothetical protein